MPLEQAHDVQLNGCFNYGLLSVAWGLPRFLKLHRGNEMLDLHRYSVVDWKGMSRNFCQGNSQFHYVFESCCVEATSESLKCLTSLDT